MRTLQNNFTTPEQSKRLLELGVPADSADFYIAPFVNGAQLRYSDYELRNTFFDEYTFTPCWSVGRLIEIYATCTDCSLFELPLEDSLIDTLIDGIEWNRLDFSKLEDNYEHTRNI